MKPAPFTLVRPESLDEALAALDEHGDDARPLAGGQSLMPMMNMRLARPAALIDLDRVPELTRVERDNGTVRIGAMTRQSALTESAAIAPVVPLLAECAPWIGHWVTRNRGTVGGSIAHADARAELPLVLAVLEGSAVVASSRGRRDVPAADLFAGHFTTSVGPDELVVETVWPVRRPGWGYAFEELALRHGDFAIAMVACAMEVGGGVIHRARLAVGGIADRPLVLDDVATSLIGRELDAEAANEASDAITRDMMLHDELHASGRYQGHLVQVLVRRALRRAFRGAVA